MKLTPEQKLQQIMLIILGVADGVTPYDRAIKSIKKIVLEKTDWKNLPKIEK